MKKGLLKSATYQRLALSLVAGSLLVVLAALPAAQSVSCRHALACLCCCAPLSMLACHMAALAVAATATWARACPEGLPGS